MEHPEDHEALSDQLEHEADQLEQRSAELRDEIADVRDDAERERPDDGVPGVAPSPESGEPPAAADI